MSSPKLEDWLFSGEALPPEGSRLTGLTGLGKSLVLAAFHQRTERPIVLVFADKQEAHSAVEQFGLFAGNEASARVHYIPASELDYYRGLLPNPEILAERNVALYHALNDPRRRVFVTTVPALLQKVMTPQAFSSAVKTVKAGEEIDRDGLVRALLEAGYQRQPTVYDPGVFSVRGGVIDVFCPLHREPVRFEFFGDLIDEIRFFEPASQRSLDKVEEVPLIPVGQSLVPGGDDYLEAATRIKDRLDGLGIPKARRDEVLERIQEGNLSSELSLLFPLLSKGSASLLDYFPKDSCFLWDGREKILAVARETELPKLFKSHELFEKEPQPIAEKGELFITEEELTREVDKTNAYYFETFVSEESPSVFTFQSFEVRLSHEREEMKSRSEKHPPLEIFSRRFKEWMDQGYRTQLVCHTQTHAEHFRSLFQPYGIRSVVRAEGAPAFPDFLRADFSEVTIWQGYVTDSQIFTDLKVVVLSEEEIFGRKKRVAKAASWVSADASRLLSSFRDLKAGDFIVHKDHGIGRYLGLKSMDFAGVTGDYAVLEYKDGDKLYIPVYRLNVLQKYVGGEAVATPPLDKLGGDRWAKAKSKATRAVAELAAEFLDMQAKRKLLPAYAFKPPGEEYLEFEMEFPFDETPDQLKAITEVQLDLGEPHPMDRLVCGDVGYGKTEVAMRAAYRAVIDGKQVAVLVPTTMLAFQHHETFGERFKSSGAIVEMISRLKTSAQIKQTLADLKAGKVDVVIGTHRLLSGDVQFKDLGLIVIDEEHRFGVVHKERLKKLCESVHVLSMTATPIPRTLNMAMAGIKNISVIATPPPDRLSVRTFVCKSAPEVVVEAITNELLRDGQVFFVHNRIESIFKVADQLRKLLPKVKIEVTHGQMDGETLEKKMLAFYRGEAQILLTTTIIESGLDIPRANTIIIDEAQNMGLAQLYQLRGRVGRSAKRAYCYLLIPGENLIGTEAKQRLQVIQRYSELGSGFNVASHDLEIRGAGDLLGKDQSGHLAAIGIDLYFELLEESIQALQGQEKPPEIEPEIAMKIAAFFPEGYLPDIGERVLLYRRLSSVESEEEISEIETEIRDRFGTPPEEVRNLLGLMTLKLYLKKLHVVRMSCGPRRTSLQFAPSTPASPEKLVRLIQEDQDERYSITPDQKLVFTVRETDWKGQLGQLKELCELLGVGC